MEINNAEIIATGKWNGHVITGQHLIEMVRNHGLLSDKIRIPLKFGHNKEQPLTDGQPALGWVTNLRIEGKKLLADFEDVPELIFNTIKASLFDRISAELAFGVEVNDKQIGTVLTGVALLGADLPAVSDLGGLKELLSIEGITSNRKPEAQMQVFTLNVTEPITESDNKNCLDFSRAEFINQKQILEEERNMSEIESLKQEMKDVKANFKSEMSELKGRTEQAEQETEKYKKAEIEALEAKEKAEFGIKVEKFSSEKTEFLGKCKGLQEFLILKRNYLKPLPKMTLNQEILL